MASPAPRKRERAIDEWLEVLRLIWTIDHKLQSVSMHLNRQLGVTGQQRLVIKLVGKFPGISAGELSEILGCHPSTLSGTFKTLTAKKLLERRVHEDDARRAMFYLTPRGRLNDSTLRGTAEVAVRRTLSGVTPEEVAGAKAVLAGLVRELQAEVDAFTQEP